MAQPPIFEDIDNLTDELVDSVNAKLQLQTLRDLCFQYNKTHTTNLIEAEEISDDKIGMILSLWMRKVEIHPSITWDEPYDSGFKKAIEYFLFEYKMTLPKVRQTIPYQVFKHPSQLPSYLASTVNYVVQTRYGYDNSEFNGDFINNFDETIDGIMTLIGLDKIDDYIPDYRFFLKILPTLTPIALIYIILVATYNPQYLMLKISAPNYIRLCYPS